MPEVKDPAIKLFGKTIHLDHVLHSKSHEQQQFCSKEFKKTSESNDHEDDISSKQSTSIRINDDPKTPTSDQEIPSKTTQKNDNPIADSNAEEKPQKPDKILPCPRCNSMDTKFCYYNNYNVNQPRHFCKNCQRYWTAGGTMRNTPVGSGRRKNKSLSSASYYRHLIVSDGCLKTNGSVLNFGSDIPLCESMNQALKFSDKSQRSEDDCSNSASNLVENGGNCGFMNGPKCAVQIPCFLPHPWGYQWNSAHYRPPVNLYNSGFPANFYPIPPYWGMPMGMQLMNPNSPLGKHSRDGNLLSASSNSVNKEPSQDKDSESLRTNDSNKAAKSSIWSTIGMSKDENGSNSINGSVLSKAFQSKIDESNEVVGSSLANLKAIPAAVSRSLNFHETS